MTSSEYKSADAEAAPLEIFTSTGALRTDYSDAEIALLSPERQERLATLFAATIAEVEANAEMAAALNNVGGATRGLSNAQTKANSVRPQGGDARRIAELRRVIAVHNGTPEPKKTSGEAKAERLLAAAIAAADDELNSAELALQDARRRVTAATEMQRRVRGDVAKAVSAWSAQFKPVTRESLIREVAARDQERKLALALGTVQEPPKPRRASHLDAVLAAGGHGKSTRRGVLPSSR